MPGSEEDYYPGVRNALAEKLRALKALIGGRNPFRHPESPGRRKIPTLEPRQTTRQPCGKKEEFDPKDLIGRRNPTLEPKYPRRVGEILYWSPVSLGMATLDPRQPWEGDGILSWSPGGPRREEDSYPGAQTALVESRIPTLEPRQPW